MYGYLLFNKKKLVICLNKDKIIAIN